MRLYFAKLSDVLPELRKKFYCHWLEAGVVDLPLSVHEEYLLSLDEQGLLQTTVVALGDEVIAYSIDQVIPYIFSKDNIVGYNIGIYTKPEYSNGVLVRKLLRKVQEGLRERGAVGHFLGLPGFKPERVGYTAQQTIYFKEI